MQPHSPPVPINATWGDLPAQVFVTFNEPIVAGPLDPTNWKARRTNTKWSGQAPAVAAGSVANVRMLAGIGDIGPNVVDYSAAVPDVVSVSHGVPAEPFLNFPIT